MRAKRLALALRLAHQNGSQQDSENFLKMLGIADGKNGKE